MAKDSQSACMKSSVEHDYSTDYFLARLEKYKSQILSLSSLYVQSIKTRSTPPPFVWMEYLALLAETHEAQKARVSRCTSLSEAHTTSFVALDAYDRLLEQLVFVIEKTCTDDHH